MRTLGWHFDTYYPEELFLYFAQHPDYPTHVKIGITKNIEQRMQTLGTRAILIIRGTNREIRDLEREYHQEFAGDRHWREYFWVSDDVLARICDLDAGLVDP